MREKKKKRKSKERKKTELNDKVCFEAPHL
jgi:hypothetical protein